MADDQWYYVQAGQRLGPVSIETLQALISAGSVHSSELVWTEGMPDWVAASTMPALFIAPTPRPVNPFVQQQPVYQQPTYAPGYGPPAYVAQPQPGYSQQGYQQPVNYAPMYPSGGYANIWERFVAMVIDYLILGVLSCVIAGVCMGCLGLNVGTVNPQPAPVPGLIHQPSYGSSTTAEQRNAQIGLGVVFMCGMIVALWWLYYARMESSSWQATLGKRAMGIRVTDYRGQRISFAQATGRFVGKGLSYMIGSVGFIIAAFTEQRQALHDMMAGCLVVRN